MNDLLIQRLVGSQARVLVGLVAGYLVNRGVFSEAEGASWSGQMAELAIPVLLALAGFAWSWVRSLATHRLLERAAAAPAQTPLDVIARE